MSTLTLRSRSAIVSLVIAERFSFHSAALVLPMFLIAAPSVGGLGWEVAEALAFVGLYVGAVQFGPILVGPITTRLPGDRQALIVGILLVVLGYLAVAVPPPAAMLKDVAPVATLLLVTIGSAIIRPMIAVMGGQIGGRTANHGFGILFVFMNLGCVLAGLIGGAAGEIYFWRLSFAIACGSMATALLPAMLAPTSRLPPPPETARSYGATWRTPIVVILVVSVIFSASFSQANGFLNLFIHNGIDRSVGGFTIPTTWLTATQPLFVLLLAPILFGIAIVPPGSNALAAFLGRSALSFTIMGMAFICLLLAVGDRSTMIEIGSILACFMLLAAAELFITPNSMAALTSLTVLSRHKAMMGTFFAASGVGGWLSGLLGAFGSTVEPWMFFAGMGFSLLLISVVLATGTRMPSASIAHPDILAK